MLFDRMRRILLIYHGWGIGGGLIAMIGFNTSIKKGNMMYMFYVFIIVMQLITLKMREFQLRS